MFLTAIVFFLILSILVLIHELGHYAVARWIGVHVEEFGLGLPPKIYGRKIGDTIYSLNWLPIGGFVRLAGEDEDSHRSGFTQKNAKHLFWARSKKERAAILTAGVAMNFLLAVGITTYLLTQGIWEPSGRVHIERVVPGSPAQESGLQNGDVIKEVFVFPLVTLVMPSKVTTPKALVDFVKAHAGEEIGLSVERNNQPIVTHLVPRKVYPKGEGPMGVAISDLELRVYPWNQAPSEAVKITGLRTKEMLVGIAQTLWRLATLQPVREDVAGPIGIAQVTGQAVKFGFKAVLEFMSILSLNLAVLNILPIPALDGGRLAFVFLEKVLGRRLRPAFERSTHQVGMIILFALILLVSINDVIRLARGS